MSRDARHVDAPRERRTPTVAFVPDPTPPPQWDGGKGSHHPDYDPHAKGHDAVKASRETEELLNAIVKVRLATGSRQTSIERAVLKPNRRIFFFARSVTPDASFARAFFSAPSPLR